MDLQVNELIENSGLDLGSAKPGLIYDTNSLVLLGKFSDELSAHRAKSEWKEVLAAHFLIENERDYTLKVIPYTGEGYYILSCVFDSACGRYVFWRLANRQAPDAEERLLRQGKRAAARAQRMSSTKLSRDVVLSRALMEQVELAEQNAGLIGRLIDIFKK